MAKHIDRPIVLMIRPWLSLVSGGDAYAHFDGVVMRRNAGVSDGRYGNYTVLLDWADEKLRTPRLHYFRFQCQTDDRRPEAYAWQWGYQPEGGGSIFGARDMKRYGPSLAAIKRGLDRMHREDGPAEGAGRFVVRLARVLKLDGIMLLETSQTGSFHDALETGRKIGPSDYGDAVRGIDDLVVELHRACARRVGKIAA
jgi:hypothetical protein